MGTLEAAPAKRVASIDAYRGFVMFLMMAELLRLSRMAQNFPESSVWSFLAYHQSHVAWRGCSLHDLIQPSFSFLVGVALPFSIASRLARGQSQTRMILHALMRALILVYLGIFLRSTGRPQTNFTFEDTLTQIGLGYPFLFALGLLRPRWHWVAVAVILVGYWLAFAAHPLPPAGFDYPAVGVPADWPHHEQGVAAHWNKNSNLAWAFDRWFLNLFPRAKPFTHNGGGYATLSFIPTLATMILGLIAGTWLRQDVSPWRKVRWLILAGLVGLAVGTALDLTGINPNVKRIWTPAWTLFSGGWCFLFLAGFYSIMDIGGWKAWAFPLQVIGMNSIAAYCLDHLISGFINQSLKTHLGQDIFKSFGPAYEPFVSGAATLFVLWLTLYWLYRRGILIRI